jgi:CheY-like chemotaxis protein
MAKILIIEDDDQVRLLIKAMLERDGHAVNEASSGAAGLELAAGETMDLIITDIIMPGMDGLEVIRELRREGRPVKILALSGGGRGDANLYITLAVKLGADFGLSKPFTRAELLDAVGSLVH